MDFTSLLDLWYHTKEVKFKTHQNILISLCISNLKRKVKPKIKMLEAFPGTDMTLEKSVMGGHFCMNSIWTSRAFESSSGPRPSLVWFSYESDVSFDRIRNEVFVDEIFSDIDNPTLAEIELFKLSYPELVDFSEQVGKLWYNRQLGHVDFWAGGDDGDDADY